MKKNVFLFITAPLAILPATAAEIHIAEQIPYKEGHNISPRITSQCTETGTILSESIAKHAAKKGITVIRSPNYESHSTYAKIEIDSATGIGSAMIGHWKGMALSGGFYQNGKESDKTTFKRHSTGGMFGGFKRSCSVFYRTANTLGKDVAGWLAAQSKR